MSDAVSRMSHAPETAQIGGEDLMTGVEFFLSLLGGGIDIAGLFGGSGPNLNDMMDKLRFEIEQIFRQALLDDAIKVATAVAQSSRDFLASDYAGAVADGVSDDKLYAMLTEGAADRGTGALDTQASILEQWANDPNVYASNAQPTIALGLAIHGLLITFYREEALRATDPAVKKAAEHSRRDYVNMAIKRVTPLVDSIVTTRLGGVGEVTLLAEANEHGVWDQWYPERRWLMLVTGGDSNWAPTPDAVTQINQARGAYLNLLNSGSAEDRAALDASIGDAFTGGDSVPTGPLLKSDFVPEFQRWGAWKVSAYNSLRHLQSLLH